VNIAATRKMTTMAPSLIENGWKWPLGQKCASDAGHGRDQRQPQSPYRGDGQDAEQVERLECLAWRPVAKEQGQKRFTGDDDRGYHYSDPDRRSGRWQHSPPPAPAHRFPAGPAPEARLAKALTGLDDQPDKGDLFGVTMRASIHLW
jgi:hypothetical protein